MWGWTSTSMTVEIEPYLSVWAAVASADHMKQNLPQQGTCQDLPVKHIQIGSCSGVVWSWPMCVLVLGLLGRDSGVGQCHMLHVTGPGQPNCLELSWCGFLYKSLVIGPSIQIIFSCLLTLIVLCFSYNSSPSSSFFTLAILHISCSKILVPKDSLKPSLTHYLPTPIIFLLPTLIFWIWLYVCYVFI